MATGYNTATGKVTAATTYDASTGNTGTGTASTATTTIEADKKKAEAKSVGKSNGSDVLKLFDTRAKDSSKSISDTYASGLNAQKQALLDAYNQNTAAQTQQGQQIEKTYDTAATDVAGQNARNAAELDRFAELRGVNTGAGSQQALSLGNAAQKASNVIEFGKAAALQENARQTAMMTTDYNNKVKEALADHDYKKAAALLDDYNNQKTWQENQAEILANYGNFSAYKNLYGDTAAITMQNVWNAQNPDVAYRTGQISAETYKYITGSYPEGYVDTSSSGSSGWYWGSSKKSTDGNGGALDSDGDGGDGGNSFTPLNIYNNGRSISRATPYKNSASTIKNTSGKIT